MIRPKITRVSTAPFADVTVLATIDDAADVALPGGKALRVQPLEVRYFFDFGAGRWSYVAKLMGRRVLRDNTLGVLASTNYPAGDPAIPAWLADFIRTHTPQDLPDLR